MYEVKAKQIVNKKGEYRKNILCFSAIIIQRKKLAKLKNGREERKMKYLVYAFYPNLGIPVRVVDFKSKREMLEYVSGLRMTDTPYAVQDVSNKDNPLMIEVEYADLSKKKMIEMLTDLAERKEE